MPIEVARAKWYNDHLISLNAGVGMVWSDVLGSHCFQRSSADLWLRKLLGGVDAGVVLERLARNGNEIDILSLPATGQSGKLAFHQICGFRDSTYAEMCGTLGDLEWGRFHFEGAPKYVREYCRAPALESGENSKRSLEKLQKALGMGSKGPGCCCG